MRCVFNFYQLLSFNVDESVTVRTYATVRGDNIIITFIKIITLIMIRMRVKTSLKQSGNCCPTARTDIPPCTTHRAAFIIIHTHADMGAHDTRRRPPPEGYYYYHYCAVLSRMTCRSRSIRATATINARVKIYE